MPPEWIIYATTAQSFTLPEMSTVTTFVNSNFLTLGLVVGIICLVLGIPIALLMVRGVRSLISSRR